MPYEGDSPVEAWEYWFHEPPSKSILASLQQFSRTHPRAEIVEAIRITGLKSPLIKTDDDRVQYAAGVLRRRALAKLDADRATAETTLDVLRSRWLQKDAGPWLARKSEVREWLQWLEQEELIIVIGTADSWDDFEALTREIVKRRRAEQRAWTMDTLMAEIDKAAVKLQIVRGLERSE